ncbi:MAG: LegC family aminotransferase [Bacteroidota bacterium]
MYSDFVAFARDLFQTPSDFLPLHEPRFFGNERKYINDAIDSTFVSSVGAYVNLFEEKMAAITGAKYAVALVNGTAALHIAIKLAGVQQGDEVICQPLTFIATANAISYEKATPHFVDVDVDTMGLSPTALRQQLETISEIRSDGCYNKETGKRIAACVPMHTFGHPVRCKELAEVCKEYSIPLIEDAAESLGSYIGEKHTGTFGLLGTFSFNGNKTVTAGGGGAIVTNDEKLAKRVKHITTTAKIPHRWEFKHDEIAYNYRMPNLNAALACAQLEQLPDYLANKRETAKRYADFFENKPIQFMCEPVNTQSNYWLNAIQLPDKKERDAFLNYTNDNGIMTRPIWHLLHELDMYQHCPKAALPNSKFLVDRIVNIPSSVRV